MLLIVRSGLFLFMSSNHWQKSEGGWIADTIVSKGLSVTTVRKIMQSIGFLGPAFFLTHLSHVKTPALAVLCMACSQMSNCEMHSQSGLYSNHQDIGPRYADCPEVHANTAETLCAITRYAPPGLAAKITSPSFIGRLFCHALEDSRPKSVLVNSLSVCISLLDPKRLTLGTYHFYSRQLSHGSTISANPETVEGMLGSLGDLLKLLDVSSDDNALITTYGKLQPPLGKHRLK
ncbi:unnamed protein product [Camellia sinensis]